MPCRRARQPIRLALVTDHTYYVPSLFLFFLFGPPLSAFLSGFSTFLSHRRHTKTPSYQLQRCSPIPPDHAPRAFSYLATYLAVCPLCRVTGPSTYPSARLTRPPHAISTICGQQIQPHSPRGLQASWSFFLSFLLMLLLHIQAPGVLNAPESKASRTPAPVTSTLPHQTLVAGGL